MVVTSNRDAMSNEVATNYTKEVPARVQTLVKINLEKLNLIGEKYFIFFPLLVCYRHIVSPRP